MKNMTNNTYKIIGTGVWIDPKVKFGNDVIIGHGSCIGYSDENNDEDNDECSIMDGVHIGAFCVISMGSILEKKTTLEHYCRVDSKVIIGENTRLLYGARAHYGAKIGKNSVIGGNVPDRTKIGNNVCHFGRIVHAINNCSAWDDNNDPSPKIDDGVFIAAGAIIVGGINIGKNSMICINEIVTKDVPPNSIYKKGTSKPREI